MDFGSTGEAVVWLSAPGKLRGRYGAAIQDTANLTELVYRLKANNPLGWDFLDALKLLSGLL